MFKLYKVAIISDSREDRIPLGTGYSQSATAILFIVQRHSFKGLGICQYLEQVTKIQPYRVLKGTGVS